MRNRNLLTLGGVLLACALAMPAAAGSLYRWTAPDGSVAFTDDPDRIPEAHRGEARELPREGLDGYARYTPVKTDHAEQLAAVTARIERLQATNRPEPAADAVGVAPAAAGPGASDAVVQLDDRTSVRIPSGSGEGHGPLVVEEVRVRRPGHIFTTHDTVVRRGDEILMVVRPDQDTEADPSDIVDERDLLR